ncbi:MAG: YihY family inner membrane protein [Gammaproteobacteria bacterium]|nr:YihY family inner membrane protein [Gammaproteobacteria bacterium]
MIKVLNNFISYITREFLRDDCFESASALTYTTLLSIVPLMTVSLVIVKEIPYFQALWIDAEQYIFRHFVPATGIEVQKYLNDFVDHAGSLTLLGILFLLFSAMMLIYTIEVTFNRIWRVRSDRNVFQTAALYLAILTFAPILMAISFVLSSYVWSLSVLQSTVTSLGILEHIINFSPIGITWICFTILYVLIPNCKVSVNNALVGAFIAAILFEVAKKLFAIYVAGINLNTLIYGTFATIPLFLFWLYISWLIILLGAQIVSALSYYRFNAVETNQSRFIQAYKWLYFFWQARQKEQALSANELFKMEGRLTNADPYTQLAELKKQGWIKETPPGYYILAMDLKKFNFYDFYRSLPWRLPSAENLKSFVNQGDELIDILYQQLVDLENCIAQSPKSSIDQQFISL